jgi:predicted Rossmann fold nucleotide-binding protein DprA/Smf involved in DNA uptake
MPATIEKVRELLGTRLGELDEEKGRVERAREALDLSNGTAPAPAGRPPKKRRKRRGGTRADQAVELIVKTPGISASDIAKAMKIKPNYLYRLLGDLETEGKVKKDGRRYYPGG